MALTTVTVGPASGGIGTMTFEGYLDFQSSLLGNLGITLPKVTCAFSNFAQPVVALANGANTLAVPTSAAGFAFVPPSTNTTITLVIKGVSGDTGVPIAKNAPYILFFDKDNMPTNIVITASGTLSGCRVLWL